MRPKTSATQSQRSPRTLATTRTAPPATIAPLCRGGDVAKGRLRRPPPRALPAQGSKRRLAGEARMEVVELAYLAGAELIVERGVVVEAAEVVLAADVVEHLVEGLLAGGPELAIRLGVGRG